MGGSLEQREQRRPPVFLGTTPRLLILAHVLLASAGPVREGPQLHPSQLLAGSRGAGCVCAGTHPAVSAGLRVHILRRRRRLRGEDGHTAVPL